MTTIPEDNPIKRPISLTIIGWLFIVLDAGNLIYLPLSLRNPLTIMLLSEYRVPPGVTILAGMIVAALCLASGVAILKGRVWGRMLYVCATVAGMAISMGTMPADMTMAAAFIPSVLLFAVFTYLLYRRPATAYFQRASV